MRKDKIIHGIGRYFLLFIFVTQAFSSGPPGILLPRENFIITYLPYKIAWSYKDSTGIDHQYLRISQDPFGDMIHLQRLLDKGARDFMLRRRLKDNEGYYLFIGAGSEDDPSVQWSKPVYFVLDHLNSPPNPFSIDTLPDTLSPGITVRWEAAGDPDPLDSLLRYILFAESLTDSTVQHEIPYMSDHPKSSHYQYDLTPHLINHHRYLIRIFAEDQEGVLTEGIPEQKTLFFNGTNTPPFTPSELTPFDLTELAPGDTIRWQTSYDADGDLPTYHVQLDTTPLFTNPVTLSTSSAYVKIRRSFNEHFPDDTRLYWRVRAYDDWGGFSRWSTFGTFYINFKNIPPYWDKTVSREEKELYITDDKQKFHWPSAMDNDFSDRDSIEYLIRIFQNTNHILFRYTTHDTFFTVPADDLKENQSYRYTITAQDRAGNHSPTFLRGKVTLNCLEEPPEIAPKIVYPPENAILNPSGRLAWRISKDPDPGDRLTYYLELSETADFSREVFTEKIRRSQLPVHAHLQSGFNRWDPKSVPFYTDHPDTLIIQLNYLSFWNHLKDNHQYFLRLYARDRKQLNSPFSQVRSFILNRFNNPPKPVKTIYFPEHRTNIKTTSPVFQWKASDDPDPDDDSTNIRYQLNIREITKNTTEYILTEPGKTRITPEYPFQENGRYELKIRSFDKKSAFSEWSEPIYFWINERPDLPVLDPGKFSIQKDSIISTPYPVLHFGEVQYPDPPEEQKELFMDIRFIFPEIEDTLEILGCPFDKQFIDSSLSYPENVWGTYEVRLKSEDRLISPWTKPVPIGFDIYADIPLPFYLLKPKENQEDTISVNPLFSWTDCEDPDLNDEITYTLYISEDSTFYQDTYIIKGIQNNKYVLYDYDLEDNTKYYWKVSAEDKDGHLVWGSDSDFQPRSFVVGRLEDAEESHRSGGNHVFNPVQPNPFKNQVTLKFTLSKSEEVTLSLYNLIGQRVITIHHGVFAAGTHTLKWDITKAGIPIPAGVYIFTLRIQNQVLQQKGLYLK